MSDMDKFAMMFEREKRLTAAYTLAILALREVAALDDEVGNRHLKAVGSYGAFDEPGSVEMARTALNAIDALAEQSRAT